MQFLVLGTICCFLMYWIILRIVPLADEKRVEGRLFAEDEKKLRNMRYTLYVLIALAFLFLLCFLVRF